MFTIDGNNNKIVMNEYGITMLGNLESNINLNGNTITNVGTPLDGNSIVNKAYVDDFIDQLTL